MIEPRLVVGMDGIVYSLLLHFSNLDGLLFQEVLKLVSTYLFRIFSLGTHICASLKQFVFQNRYSYWADRIVAYPLNPRILLDILSIEVGLTHLVLIRVPSLTGFL